MAENEPIKGYRVLSEKEVSMINRIKAHAEETRVLLEEVKEVHNDNILNDDFAIDHRWHAIAKTGLQTGFMALVRSVARPETF